MKCKQRGEIRVVNKIDAVDIVIYGPIGEGMFEDGNSSKPIKTALDQFDGSEINVSINSVGGDAAEGVAIYNTLKRHDARVNVYIDGVALSAGSVIAMAGDEIRMASNGLMMIHDAMTESYGNASDMRKTADILDSWSDAIATTYKERTSKTDAEIREMMQAETWMTADEAVELGFADSVEGVTENVTNVATDIYDNYPKSHSVLEKVEAMEKLIKMSGQYTPQVKPEKDPVEDSTEEKDPVLEEQETPDDEAVEEAEVVNAEDDEEDDMEAEAAGDDMEDDDKKEAKNEVVNQLQAFMNAFGPKGAEWFAEGKTFEACRTMQVNNLQKSFDKLREENADLKKRLKSVANQGDEMVPVHSNNGSSGGAGMAQRLRMPN